MPVEAVLPGTVPLGVLLVLVLVARLASCGGGSRDEASATLREVVPKRLAKAFCHRLRRTGLASRERGIVGTPPDTGSSSEARALGGGGRGV